MAKAKTKRPVLCTILGILAIIGAALGFIGIMALGGLSIFTAGMGFSTVLIVGLILGVIAVVISIMAAIGFLKMKKWVPTLMIVALAINLIQYVSNIFVSDGSWTAGLLSLAIYIAILVYVFMNKKLFKN